MRSSSRVSFFLVDNHAEEGSITSDCCLTSMESPRLAISHEPRRDSIGDVGALPAFRRFLAAVCRRRPTSTSTDKGEQFAAFIEQANHLVVPSVLNRWKALRSDLAVLRRWFADCDLLGRIASLEDSYTEMIAWALSPETHNRTHKRIAELSQRNWLTSLGMDWPEATPAKLETWPWTEDGIPDLVLRSSTHAVVVEVKTKSQEHPAPSGKLQTDAYHDSVAKELGLPSDAVDVVFLTPDGRRPASKAAVHTTFAHFALVLAKVLDKLELHQDLRVPFRMLITLFATYPPSPIKSEPAEWEREGKGTAMVGHRNEILLIEKLLSGGSYV